MLIQKRKKIKPLCLTSLCVDTACWSRCIPSQAPITCSFKHNNEGDGLTHCKNLGLFNSLLSQTNIPCGLSIVKLQETSQKLTRNLLRQLSGCISSPTSFKGYEGQFRTVNTTDLVFLKVSGRGGVPIYFWSVFGNSIIDGPHGISFYFVWYFKDSTKIQP